jgi:hypothetical protein
MQTVPDVATAVVAKRTDGLAAMTSPQAMSRSVQHCNVAPKLPPLAAAGQDRRHKASIRSVRLSWRADHSSVAWQPARRRSIWRLATDSARRGAVHQGARSPRGPDRDRRFPSPVTAGPRAHHGGAVRGQPEALCCVPDAGGGLPECLGSAPRKT